MAISAADVFNRARRLAQDEDSVRWPLVEMRDWLNDGMKQLVLLKPSAYSTTVIVTLAAGTRQTLPTTYMALLEVHRNIKVDATSGAKAVRMMDRDILNSQLPNWHDTTLYPAAVLVKQACYSPKNPHIFWVYPANDGTGRLEITVSSVPTQVSLPASSANYENIADTAYTTALVLEDVWLPALTDYVLFRAYSKDMGNVGNAQRAAAHYKMFGDSVGVKLSIEAIFNPNTNRGGAAVTPAQP